MSKRVIRIMMVGLVAMLGATAEAHYIVVRGQCIWHSGECTRKDDQPDPPPPPPPLDPTNPPPLGEVRMTPTSVEILCPNGITVKQFVLKKEQLVAQRPLVPADITKTTNEDGINTYAEWGVIASDTHFFLADTTTCPGFPKDVIIRSMSVEMNLYDLKLDPTATKPHSAWRATCTLPVEFKLPQKPPPRGVPYQCTTDNTCHEPEVPCAGRPR
jgi:hypothetical protein